MTLLTAQPSQPRAAWPSDRGATLQATRKDVLTPFHPRRAPCESPLPAPAGQTPPPPEQDPAERDAKECEAASAYGAVALYYRIRRNPQNKDERELMAACLVRKGVVPAGYSATDFQRDTRAQPPPSYLESAAALACSADPLNS